MVRRSFWRLCVALVVALALATPAFAGGWTVVTLDTLPSDIQAGQSVSLGFMVRQHGVTPVDTHLMESNRSMPILAGRNTATGATIEANARKDGPTGHYVVDVTFPSAGSWDIEIIPPPFGGTKLGVFTVVAATTKAPNTAQPGSQSAAGVESQPLDTHLRVDGSPRGWWLMALVIGVALALTALVQRESLARLVAARTSRSARSTDEPQTSHSRAS